MKIYNKLGILLITLFLCVNQGFAIVDTVKVGATKNEVQKVKTQKVIYPQLKAEEQDPSKIYSNDVHSVFTLKDCVDIAVKYNPQIRSCIYSELAQKTKIAQAWSNYFPTISAGVQIERVGYSFSKYTSVYNTCGYLPTLSGNMLFFDFGKTKAQADSAKSTFEARHETTQENINAIIADIKTTYYNILFAQAQVYVYEDTVKDFELQLKQAEGFHRLGKKAKIDVVIAEYNRDKAILNLIKARNVLAKAKVQLATIMGVPEYSNFELSDEMSLSEVDCEIENAIQTALSVRPELLSVEKMMKASKMDLRVQKRQFTPNINGFASYGNTIGNSFDMTSFQIGAGLSYSNFNILKTKKQIDEAKMLFNKSKADYENKKNTVYNNVKQGFLDMQTARGEIITAKSSLDQAKEQARQAMGRYKAGVSDAIELKDSENTFLNARLDFYNAMLHYNTSVASLEKEIGSPIVFSDKKIINISK